ncbi:MAG: prepilin-type N-terminal cleavage/methylation domain-containing protein, partial [Pseudomonadota bacterium]
KYQMNSFILMIKSKKAFTLVELSIVLVIIGLIVFAIKSGADLIRSGKLEVKWHRLVRYKALHFHF